MAQRSYSVESPRRHGHNLISVHHLDTTGQRRRNLRHMRGQWLLPRLLSFLWRRTAYRHSVPDWPLVTGRRRTQKREMLRLGPNSAEFIWFFDILRQFSVSTFQRRETGLRPLRLKHQTPGRYSSVRRIEHLNDERFPLAGFDVSKRYHRRCRVRVGGVVWGWCRFAGWPHRCVSRIRRAVGVF